MEGGDAPAAATTAAPVTSRATLAGYAAALGSVIVATLARMALNPVIGNRIPFATYFLAVAFASWFGGLGPGLTTVGLSIVAAAYFFIPPSNSLTVTDIADLVSLGTLTLSGSVMALLSEAQRKARQRAEASAREARDRREQLEHEVRERERAQGALQAADRRATDVLESITEAFVALDHEWRFTYVNARAAERAGRTREEMIGQAVWDVFPGIWGTALATEMQRAMTEQVPVHFEARYSHDRWFECHAYPTPEGVSVYFREITDRKQAEEALRRSEELLATTLRSIGDAVIVTDAQGRLTFMNAIAQELTGWTEADAQGRDANEVFHIVNETTRATVESPIDRVVREGGIVGLANHTVLIARDGTERPIDDSGAPILDDAGNLLGVVLVFRDVTDRRRAAEALSERETQLRLALDAARMGTWNWNVPTNELTWHGHLEAIHGMAPGSFDGRFETYVNVIHPEDRGRTLAAISEALESGEDFNTEFRVIFPDGSLHWVAGEGSVFRDETGRPVRMVGVGLDVTARKQAEEALQAALEEQKHIASTLQRALLLAPPEGWFPGFAFRPFYEPASTAAQVGGDFYDIFLLSDGRIALVMGDVAGSGLIAAARTAEVKFSLRAYLHEYADPALAMARLNEFMAQTQHPAAADQFIGSMVCVSLAVVDLDRGTVTFAAAGAEPPVIVRGGGGGEADVVTARGLPLGVAPDAAYETQEMPLAPGDLLALFTDGLTEARRGRREFLGHDGVCRLAGEAIRQASLDAIGETIMGGVRAFAGGRLQDDACLLIARRLPK